MGQVNYCENEEINTGRKIPNTQDKKAEFQFRPKSILTIQLLINIGQDWKASFSALKLTKYSKFGLYRAKPLLNTP